MRGAVANERLYRLSMQVVKPLHMSDCPPLKDRSKHIFWLHVHMACSAPPRSESTFLQSRYLVLVSISIGVFLGLLCTLNGSNSIHYTQVTGVHATKIPDSGHPNMVKVEPRIAYSPPSSNSTSGVPLLH